MYLTDSQGAPGKSQAACGLEQGGVLKSPAVAVQLCGLDLKRGQKAYHSTLVILVLPLSVSEWLHYFSLHCDPI